MKEPAVTETEILIQVGWATSGAVGVTQRDPKGCTWSPISCPSLSGNSNQDHKLF